MKKYRVVKPQCLLEKEEQKIVVNWFRKTYPEHKIISIRNDGLRTQIEKVEQIRMGLCRGASDLYIPVIHTWIEMKRFEGGIWSEEQREFCEYVKKCNDMYFLCAGSAIAIKAIGELMSDESKKYIE